LSGYAPTTAERCSLLLRWIAAKAVADRDHLRHVDRVKRTVERVSTRNGEAFPERLTAREVGRPESSRTGGERDVMKDRILEAPGHGRSPGYGDPTRRKPEPVLHHRDVARTDAVATRKIG